MKRGIKSLFKDHNPTFVIEVIRFDEGQWKIKRESNDHLRQRFIDRTVAQAEYLGLTIPDPNLKKNEETGHYETSPFNWDEFWNVVNGNGPCNQERLDHHITAHEENAWVREAAVAYASKLESKVA